MLNGAGLNGGDSESEGEENGKNLSIGEALNPSWVGVVSTETAVVGLRNIILKGGQQFVFQTVTLANGISPVQDLPSCIGQTR